MLLLPSHTVGSEQAQKNLKGGVKMKGYEQDGVRIHCHHSLTIYVTPSHTVGSEPSSKKTSKEVLRCVMVSEIRVSIYVTVTIPHGGLGTNIVANSENVTIPHGGLGTGG